jgi:excisionase family DNA binding protein
VISVPEAARRLGITKQAVHGLIKRGRLSGVRASGKAWLVDEKHVADRIRALAAERGELERRGAERRATTNRRQK